MSGQKDKAKQHAHEVLGLTPQSKAEDSVYSFTYPTGAVGGMGFTSLHVSLGIKAKKRSPITFADFLFWGIALIGSYG